MFDRLKGTQDTSSIRLARVVRWLAVPTFIGIALVNYTWGLKTVSAFGSTGSSNSSATTDPRQARAVKVILREGTLVGPVRGRFVLRGQRWRFLVQEHRDINKSDLSKLVNGGVAKKVLPRQDSILRRNPQSGNSVAQQSRSGFGSGGKNADRRKSPNSDAIFDSMLVIENLMLDRISIAIEEDPDDNAWTITGRVTEFQNENRLMLTTAFRASSAVKH